MLARLGEVLYLLAVVLAGLLAVGGVVATVYFGKLGLAVAGLVAAAIVWAIGWAILYVLAGD